MFSFLGGFQKPAKDGFGAQKGYDGAFTFVIRRGLDTPAAVCGGNLGA